FLQQTVFPVGDDLQQTVRLTTFRYANQSFAVLAYGDDTATNIVEFDSSGNEVAAFVDPTTQVFGQLINLGDSRIAIAYDNNLDANFTSQYDFKIFDLRSVGLIIDDRTLTDNKTKYVAGTHFDDTFFGEPNTLNEYYFVGQGTRSGTAPIDTFTGGNFGLNVAIFPDAKSHYNVTLDQISGSL